MNPDSRTTAFRDFARERANWQPGAMRAACKDTTPMGRAKEPDHTNCGGNKCGCPCHAPTDREREWFRRLADEIDAFLTRDEGGEGLW